LRPDCFESHDAVADSIGSPRDWKHPLKLMSGQNDTRKMSTIAVRLMFSRAADGQLRG
jgi:hypothetical protein